jgi:hypothetical protein
MNRSTMPGFTAADSLSRARERYSMARTADVMATDRIIPQRMPLCGVFDQDCLSRCLVGGGGSTCYFVCCEMWN